MGCLTRVLAYGCMLLLWNDSLIGGPKIRVAMPCSIRLWNGFPENPAGLFAPISYRIGDDLTRFATQGDPDPGLIGLFEHKGPQFIQFQYRRFWILLVRGDQRFAQCGQLFCFFLIHAMTEVRETPNVRSIPRKLLRS